MLHPEATPSPSQSQSQLSQSAGEQTKKQRQNHARAEAKKAAREEAEAARLAKLAEHQRNLQRERMAEQYASSKKPGNGQKASVAGGHLVFE